MLTKTEKTLTVLQERSSKGKDILRLYRELFKPELYRMAYANIYANKGAITKGSTEDTLDGMSEERIDNIIQLLKGEKYRWNPVRRTYIPKSNSKDRPLGIPSGDDKLLQAAMKILLEAIYEPTFSECSHGFRPGLGCHTALIRIAQKHKHTSWFIEGDIKGCFDNIDHRILLEIISKKVKDGRFLELIRKLLKAGYMENWRKYATHSGTPQGGIISPLLSNIYMNELDRWVEDNLLPKYNRSHKGLGVRRENPDWRKLTGRMSKAKKQNNMAEYKATKRARQEVPSVMTHDPEYRKLTYTRYADDFILNFAGPIQEAREIKEEIRIFLKDRLKLELSEEKTLITHGRTKKAKFLGYELGIMHNKERKRANGMVYFGEPREVVTEYCRRYSKGGKMVHRAEMTNNSDYDIVMTYQLEYRGLVQYYQMAHNLRRLTKVNWIMQGSMLKTLAHKHKVSVSKISKKFRAMKEIKGQQYKIFKVEVRREGKKPLIAEYGAIPLIRNPLPAELKEYRQRINWTKRTELLARLLAEQCEMCGKTENVEVHHIRALKDINKPGRKSKPAWMIQMAEMRRKTLIVCRPCHQAIHKGENRQLWNT